MPKEPPKCPLCDVPPQSAKQVRNLPGVLAVECERCGTYQITHQARIQLHSEYNYNRRHFFSAVTRRASDIGQPIELSPNNLEELFATLHLPNTPLPIIDRLLLDIAERTISISMPVPVDGDDYPLYYQRKADDVNALLGLLHQMGRVEQVEPWLVRITPGGWQHVEALEAARIQSKQAFVAMWFDPKMDDAYTDGIKPALEATGFTPFRVDRTEFTGKIDDRIIVELRRSGFLIADFTGHRQGVYFETGFAMGLGREVIWCCHFDHIEAAHFDTRQYNHITWRTPAELRTRLINRIRAIIPSATLQNDSEADEQEPPFTQL